MLSGLTMRIIMRTLNNDKGSLLVILIIAMTLIAVLGASFVSVVGSKNEAFTFLVNGQKANMIARAGVEWAIRYISDGLINEDSDYYRYKNHLEPANPGLSFAGGSFTVKWTYDPANIANDNIKVDGSFQGITETIMLSNFRQFLKPITLSPTTPPTLNGSRELRVPVIGNNSGIRVNLINLRISDWMLLQKIEINDMNGTRKVFDFTDNLYPVKCSDNGYNPPCLWDSAGIYLGYDTEEEITEAKGLTGHDVINNGESTYIFTFLWNSHGKHTIKFNSPYISTITFTP